MSYGVKITTVLLERIGFVRMDRTSIYRYALGHKQYLVLRESKGNIYFDSKEGDISAHIKTYSQLRDLFFVLLGCIPIEN